jgi:hypothetical protein
VRAAIAIADAEGSSRCRCARWLRRSMPGVRLYGYMSTKEELLELMVDVVCGEGVGRTDPR